MLAIPRHPRIVTGWISRALLFAFLFLPLACLHAERKIVRPFDFEPLTRLPWEKADALLDQVLDAIYCEPNLYFRRTVLAAYLRLIPVEKIEAAFNRCASLEDTQSPDDLVQFFHRDLGRARPGKMLGVGTAHIASCPLREWLARI